jgi:DNA-binding transcriptional LysR family regulator
MTLDQLIAFVAVAEDHHFRRAAERLGLPQPTLSARISALEERLGFLLFERKKNGASLTMEGARFKHHAQIAIGAMHAGQQSGQLPRGVSAVFSLGLPVYLSDSLGKHVVRNLPPDFGLRVECGYSDTLIAQTAAGLLDASIVLVPRISSDLEVELIANYELALVATPACAADENRLWLNYIQIQWGHNFFEFQARALKTSGIPRYCINQPSLAFDLILELGGAAWLPVQLVEGHLNDGSLVLVEGYPRYEIPIYLVHRKREGQRNLQELKQLLVAFFSRDPRTSPDVHAIG